jgi:transcriptional regulator with XRE-family HTH domain
LKTSPKAKAAYDRTLAEGRLHQADLAKLRKARALAQKAVGELMGMNQSEVSPLERRSDLLLSTLRKFVEATGGELVMVARYPTPTLRYSLARNST